MKSAMLAGVMTLALGTVALAQGGNWVVGNSATGRCEIVTDNPVIYPRGGGGNFWFGDGPYKSVEDARLARSTINACPPEPPPSDRCDGCDKDRKD